MRAVLVAVAAAVAAVVVAAAALAGRQESMQTYVARAWDGAGWSCPAGTRDTGDRDNSKACANQ